MIISHAHRFAVLLPWKTASQTVVARLGRYNESPHDGFFHFNRHLNRVVHQHLTCADFNALPESRLGYVSAAFVRNPYDRVYSGFRQLQRDIQEQADLPFAEPWIGELVRAQLAENQAQLRQAGFDFDAWLALVREEQIFEAGRNTSLPLHPVHYWTHLAGRQYVDVVGRFEQFEADFAAFVARVGIASPARIDANVSAAAGEYASNRWGYRYTDRMQPRSLDKISVLFCRDFELFGYERVH